MDDLIKNLFKLIGKFLLSLSLIFFTNGLSFGQISPGTIPDGTQGETFKITEADTAHQPITFQNFNHFDGTLSTLKIGGGFLYEYAGYIQDDIGKQQMDSAGIDLKHAFETRDFRLTLSGRLKTKRFITWKAGIMYDGESGSWFIRETGIMFGIPQMSGNVFIGRTKEGFSMNKIMNGYAGWGLERQMALDVIPILADGIKWMGFLPRQRLLLNVGVFTDWLSEKQSFSTYNWQFALRLGWLPFYSEDNRTVLHIGACYRYGDVSGNEIQVRSRPESFTGPFFISTGKFPTDHSNHFGGEFYFSSQSFMFGGEYYVHKFSSAETDNPLFQGGEVMASYIITGESRAYSTVSGIYAFVPVNKSVFKGGPGAWEVVLRFTELDLDGGTLKGGRFWRLTPMMNWYLSENVRLEFAYGYGVLYRFSLEGTTQFFQSRIQFSL